jgi:hypothetical protein
VVFHGREPSDVTAPDAIRRLSGNPEFETIYPLDHDGDGKKGGSLPKQRGRPRKQLERGADPQGV